MIPTAIASVNPHRSHHSNEIAIGKGIDAAETKRTESISRRPTNTAVCRSYLSGRPSTDHNAAIETPNSQPIRVSESWANRADLVNYSRC